MLVVFFQALMLTLTEIYLPQTGTISELHYEIYNSS